MKPFSEMTRDEALEYCYARAKQYKADAYSNGEDGEEQFGCLIAIVEDGTITPAQLPEYGMEYGQTDAEMQAARAAAAQEGRA